MLGKDPLDDLLRLSETPLTGLAEAPRRSSCGRGRGALRPARGRVKPQAAVRRVFSLRGAGPSCSQCGTQPGSVCLPAARGTVSSIPTHHGYTVTTLPHDFNVDSLTIKLTV